MKKSKSMCPEITIVLKNKAKGAKEKGPFLFTFVNVHVSCENKTIFLKFFANFLQKVYKSSRPKITTSFQQIDLSMKLVIYKYKQYNMNTAYYFIL